MFKLDLEYLFYIFMYLFLHFSMVKKQKIKKSIRNPRGNYLNQNTTWKHLLKQLITNFSLLSEGDLSQNPYHSLTSTGRKA